MNTNKIEQMTTIATHVLKKVAPNSCPEIIDRESNKRDSESIPIRIISRIYQSSILILCDGSNCEVAAFCGVHKNNVRIDL